MPTVNVAINDARRTLSGIVENRDALVPSELESLSLLSIAFSLLAIAEALNADR